MQVSIFLHVWDIFVSFRKEKFLTDIVLPSFPFWENIQGGGILNADGKAGGNELLESRQKSSWMSFLVIEP